MFFAHQFLFVQFNVHVNSKLISKNSPINIHLRGPELNLNFRNSLKLMCISVILFFLLTQKKTLKRLKLIYHIGLIVVYFCL